MIVAELFAKLGLIPDEGQWKHGHELVEGLHHAVEAYLGFEALKKVKELVEGTVEAAVEAKHLGERLSITSEAVQELGYAADVTGSSSEGMQQSLQRLALGLQHLKQNGTGPAADALRSLGVPLSELKGENLEQNLETIADHFAKLPEGANKTALAMELFGRAGAQLIPLLNKGGGGIRELRAEAERLGVVMSDEMVEKSEQFELSQKKLGATLTGLRNTAVEALLPTLQKMVDALTEWVAENREAIVSTLETVIHGIAEAFRIVGEVISGATEFMQEHEEVVVSALQAIGLVLAAFAAEAAAEWIIAFAPIIAIIAAITALILLAKNWAEVWDFVKEKVGDAWEWIVNKGEEFADWFESLPGRVLDWAEGIGDSIKQAFQDAWDYVVRGAHQAWEDIKDTPIIGHLIKGAGAVADFFEGDEAGRTGIANSFVSGNGFSVPGGYGGGGDNNVTTSFGDTHINIDAGGMDPEDVGDMVRSGVREAHQDLVRQAYNNVAGGKR